MGSPLFLPRRRPCKKPLLFGPFPEWRNKRLRNYALIFSYRSSITVVPIGISGVGRG